MVVKTRKPKKGYLTVDCEKATDVYDSLDDDWKTSIGSSLGYTQLQRILGIKIKTRKRLFNYYNIQENNVEKFSKVIAEATSEKWEIVKSRFVVDLLSEKRSLVSTATRGEQVGEYDTTGLPSPDARPDGSADKGRSSREEKTKQLIAAVRNRIFQLLKGSAKATSRLSNVLPPLEYGESAADPAEDVAYRLVKSKWDEVIDALRKVADGFISFNDHDLESFSVIKKITRELVVLLFDSEELDRLRAEMDQQPGALVQIPVGSTTFAEIVMARLEDRKPLFSSALRRDDWISGANAMASPPIEGPDNFMGFVRAFEEVIFQKYPHVNRPANGETCALNESKGKETAARCQIFRDLLIETAKETVEVAKQVTKRGRLYFIIKNDDRYTVDHAGFRKILDGLQKEWPMIPFIRLAGDNARVRAEIGLLWAIRQWLVEDKD